MKSFQAIALICSIVAVVPAIPSTQAAIVSGSIKNNNIEDYSSIDGETCLIQHDAILFALDNAYGEENCSVEIEMISTEFQTEKVLAHITTCSVCPTPGYYGTKVKYFAIGGDGDPDDLCPYNVEYTSTYSTTSLMETEYLYEGGGANIFKFLSEVIEKIYDPPVRPAEMPSRPSIEIDC